MVLVLVFSVTVHCIHGFEAPTQSGTGCAETLVFLVQSVSITGWSTLVPTCSKDISGLLEGISMGTASAGIFLPHVSH